MALVVRTSMHGFGPIVFGLALLLAPGCRRKDVVAKEDRKAKDVSGTPSAHEAIHPVDSIGMTAVVGLDASTDGGAPNGDPYAPLPRIETLKLHGPIGESYAGFSSDDRYLGYQIETCETCVPEFHFVRPGAPELSFAYFLDPTLEEDVRERRAKAHDAEVRRKLVALGVQKVVDGQVLRGPFPYPDLTFATKTSRDVDAGTVTLHFGARVGTDPPVYPMRVVLGPSSLVPLEDAGTTEELRHAREVFMMDPPVLAYANVTRDGSELGIVALAAGPGWNEAGGVARMTVAKFVSSVYAGTRSRRDAAP